MPSDRFVLCAVGDVGPDREDPAALFEKAGDVLRSGDITFCQLEVALTDRGTRLPQARHTVRTSPKAAKALREAGFTVVSWAGNHCMDWGTEGFQDTIDALSAEGMAVPGVGADIRSAREPRVVEVKGTRVAFLAYCSILPMNYWADERRPGCAPMRAFTVYEQVEHDQPGTPARVHTYPHRDDLRALEEDIAAARAEADAVVVSLHWGIHFIPAALADYQRDVAHAAIDAGADVILGHHAHLPKGVEVYKGRPVFYSLGNFAIDLRMTPEHAASQSFQEIQRLSPDWEVDFESTHCFPPDSHKSLIVKCEFEGGKLVRAGFQPVQVDRWTRPEPLEPSDPRFEEIVGYLEKVSADQGLATTFRREGTDVVIEGVG
ncbi:CapA family protein [Actinomadura nitritigenes]|uniref:CapA family protein n=1 Tax=Actinomadura nitritigenes TaxID=134602 RepID=UPI003D92CD47